MTPKEAYYKCWGNSKRDKYLEKIIIKDPQYAYYYAKDIIKGRWNEAEPIIIQDPGWAYYYALFVIEGKLPENMHNAMLAYADTWAKRYFNFINNPPYSI